MTGGNEWTEWISHNGKGCPVPVGTWVMTETNFDGVVVCIAGMTRIGQSGYRAHGAENTEGLSSWVWLEEGPGYFGVIRYRIRKPRALTQLRDMVENLPAPERERADT